MTWLTILRYWQETYQRRSEEARRLRGERDHHHVRAMEAEFVLSVIARGIPFRGESDPRKVATMFMEGK